MKRPLLVPEVVQSSAMDCGPASLKAMLEGFGISIDYSSLREACLTDVDGSSIDTLESLAFQVGLDAEQVVVPAENLFAVSAKNLPCVAVVQLPNGLTHFVVVWRVLGPWVQLMDPAVGRRWITRADLYQELYSHRAQFPASDFLDWSKTDDFQLPLRERAQRIGVLGSVESYLAQPGFCEEWRNMAFLDAAIRLLEEMKSKRFSIGSELFSELERDRTLIPDSFYRIRPFSATPQDSSEPSPEMIELQGALFVRCRGLVRPKEALPESVERALSKKVQEPFRQAYELSKPFIKTHAIWLVLLSLVSAGGVIVESLALRTLLSLSTTVPTALARSYALGAVMVILGIFTALEGSLNVLTLRVGRLVEMAIRLVLYRSLALQDDHFFKSRLLSDLAVRAHLVQSIRQLPETLTRIVRSGSTLLATAVAMGWLFPSSIPWSAAMVSLGLLGPLLIRTRLRELDLRSQTHQGVLARFHLDAMLGLSPVRAHGGEPAILTEHEGLLVEWARAKREFLATRNTFDLVQSLLQTALLLALVLSYVRHDNNPAGALLLVYWAVSIPLLSQDIVADWGELPQRRNAALRVMEPILEPQLLVAQDETPTELSESPMSYSLTNVSVEAGGRTLLEDVTFSFEQGEHIAIVGPSGSGKSTLVGLFLGVSRPTKGALSIMGERGPLDPAAVKKSIAWVDPEVWIWNHTVHTNLVYGVEHPSAEGMGRAIRMANFEPVLEQLEDGLSTIVGEDGRRLSGGQAQRLRFARSMGKDRPELAILDEAFRGLEFDQRHELMKRARETFKSMAMLCVTHDIRETLDFPRVVVIEAGRIVEDGPPAVLKEKEGGRFRALLETEKTVRTQVWSEAAWRTLTIEDTSVSEAHDPP